MENEAFVNQTVLHPLGLTAVLILGITMLLSPRRYALVPLAIMMCFIAPAQRIAVFTLNFDLLRVMVLFGTARVLGRREWRGFQWRLLDVMIIAWTIVGTLAYCLLFATPEALKFRLGASYDIIGVYLLGRCLIKDFSDVETLIKGFIVISVPLAAAFMVEHATGRNMFALLGGVPDMTLVREDRLRCQGAFAHPILAGCFWASLVPLIIALWWRRGQARWPILMGLVCLLTVIYACASSTPVLAVLFGTLGLCLYPVRKWMAYLRWGMFAMLIGLHMVMQTPVWHLVSRVDLAGGSTGWYRFILIDEWIHRFSEWWLVGVVTTEHWGARYAYSLVDITNQFVLEGVRGGILTVVLFTAVIAVAFRDVGRMWRAAGGKGYHALLAWALGVSLFIHCTDFIAVSYFGQIRFLYYLLLAAIGSLAAMPVRKLPEPANRTVRSRFARVTRSGGRAGIALAER